MTRIHLSAPDQRGQELEAVQRAIRSNWLAPVGPDLASFETELASACGTVSAVGLSSGTAAIHLALLNLGVGDGDIVVCSSLTFAGSAFPILYVGATPLFVDSAPGEWGMDPDLLDAALAAASRRGDRIGAVIVVDLYGEPADHDALAAVCARYEVPIIEDAAEGLGAEHPSGPLGSFGTCGIVSFNGNKIITTSGGGALVSDDRAFLDRTRFLASQAREPAVHYEHMEVGFNYRLSNVLAALGRAQLATLSERIERRREIAGHYATLAEERFEVRSEPVRGRSNHWLTCAILPSRELRDDLISALEALDIESRPVWKPMHLQPVFGDAPRQVSGEAERLFERGICLPSGSGMTDPEIERVLAGIRRFLSEG